MKKRLLGVISFLFMVQGAAWAADEAMQLYNLGVESSMAYKKIEYFTKALELNPKMIEAYKKRGMLFYYQEKFPRAIHDFKRVAEQSPMDTMPLHMLSLAYLKLGNIDDAVLNLTRSIELNPQDATAFSHRSEAYFMKGMIEAAIKDADKAIELGGREPIIGKAYTIRSKAYRALGKTHLADADFNKALTLNPEYYKYTLASSTEFLADMAGKSSDLKHLGWMGIALIVALCVVVILKLALPPPNKDDTR
ncbi:MAG: tetratricopeptide repeat protein [Desulfobacterales bacterium]|nr:MAG: tetratricopeptide repeat protein [Desulfobacterales bacterium]